MISLKRLSYIWIALVFAAFFFLPVLNVRAEESYNYVVRIYAGKEGVFTSAGASKNGVAGSVENGGAVIVYKDVEPGDVISFDSSTVSLSSGDKYYVKGIRESGKDNYDPEHPQLSAFTVTGDEDYVVAYAMLGSSVAYTVNYVDANGNALSPSQTFYGNIGDKPVIAYRYIDSYFPQAYNLTGVLSANAAENVFTFVYQAVEGTDNTAGAAGANIQGAGLNDGALPAGPDGMQQVIDINGGDTPTANGGNGSDGNNGNGGNGANIPDNPTPAANSGHTLAWILGGVGIAAAIAIIIAIIIAFVKRRKKQD